MKKFTQIIVLFVSFTGLLQAQSTKLAVYNIFQEKCVSCHSNTSPEAALDLEGVGANIEEKANDVYNNIVGATPTNEFAANKGYHYIYPGRVEKSFLFRKISDGFEPIIAMEGEELETQPPTGSPQLTEIEKELMRQWILFGAPSEGKVIEEQLLEDFYINGMGLESFPDGPPQAPQVDNIYKGKVGPFFVSPGAERVLHYKYEIDLDSDLEAIGVDVILPPFSHHFNVYELHPLTVDVTPPGFTEEGSHTYSSTVFLSQQSAEIRLPEGTAYRWYEGMVLHAETHFINYSSDQVLKCEVYFNSYTQDAGIAKQEMKVALVANGNLPIPNNGNEIFFEQEIDNIGGHDEIWIWTIGGHTHGYGNSQKLFRRLANGEKGEQLYDGACPGGIPGCPSPFFDYQHIPLRFVDDYFHVDFNSGGLISEASYINDGPVPVDFGFTANDEMMVVGIAYLIDTTGLNLITSTGNLIQSNEAIKVYPNPMRDYVNFEFPDNNGKLDLDIFNAFGELIFSEKQISDPLFTWNRKDLNNGMYIYRFRDDQGNETAGKLLIE